MKRDPVRKSLTGQRRVIGSGRLCTYLYAHSRASRMSLLLNYLETLSLLISNSTIRAACSIRPNNSSGKFYWSRCCVWSPMLWAASLATRAVASEILTLLLSMRCTSAFSRLLCAAMKSCGDRARMMLFRPSIWHCTAFRV